MNAIEQKLIKLNNTQEERRNELVNSLIRKKYSLSEELAVSRKRDVNPQEFEEFYNYCEECIVLADKILAEEQNTDQV